MWMKCILPDEDIRRSTSSAADDLLVQYHLFQTGIFFGTNDKPRVFGDAEAAESGDMSSALFVVPGVDFALAWVQVFSWLDGSETRWVYEHPDDAASLVLEKVSPAKVRISLNWKPDDAIDVAADELRELSAQVVDELVIKLARHLPDCPAEDVEDSLAELEEAFAAVDKSFERDQKSDG